MPARVKCLTHIKKYNNYHAFVNVHADEQQLQQLKIDMSFTVPCLLPSSRSGCPVNMNCAEPLQRQQTKGHSWIFTPAAQIAESQVQICTVLVMGTVLMRVSGTRRREWASLNIIAGTVFFG